MEREPAPSRSRWSVYRPSRTRASEDGPAPSTTPPAITRAGPTGPARPRTSRVGIAVAAGAVLVVLGVVGVAGYLGSDRSGGPFGGKVQVLTEDGMAGLVEALEEETGRTEAFPVTLYPSYAVVDVPVDDTSQRKIGYYWDGGDLDEWGSKGTSTDDRFDLADIDVDLLLPLVRQARAQVDEPDSWYVSIDHSGEEDGWISAYATNEYSEGGYIEVDLDGTEIRRVTWPTEPGP